MELDAPERKFLVVNAHDEAVVGHCIHFEAIGKVAYDQGMVARRIEGRGDALEHLLPVVADLAELAMHRLRGVRHGPPREVSYALVAEADPEDWLAVLLQDGFAESEIAPPFRAARSGGEDDCVKIQVAKLSLGQSVVANYDRIDSGRRGDELHKVISKTVVIVDDKCPL